MMEVLTPHTTGEGSLGLPSEIHSLPVLLNSERILLLCVGSDDRTGALLEELFLRHPRMHVRLVAENISRSMQAFAERSGDRLQVFQRIFQPADVSGAHLVICALRDPDDIAEITSLAKRKGLLVNVVGDAEGSDFNFPPAGETDVLGRQGAREASALPHDVRALIDHFAALTPRGTPADRRELERLTGNLLRQNPMSPERKAKRIATYSLIVFACMLVGHFIFSYVGLTDMAVGVRSWYGTLDQNFHWMVLAGFLAQLVDGALGMGYGVTSATILLSAGISPASISGSIHTAEMFASGASGYSHYKFGNVNKKLFKTLVVPGVVGAIAGAVCLTWLGAGNAFYLRIAMAAYTLFLGVRILLNAFQKKVVAKKVTRYGLLAGAGGFLDSFGGGGWGPIVTTTLITSGRSPKYVIGSVSLTEFFVTFASAFTFFTLLGISHWQVILALIIGGFLAAPLAAKLAGKLPRRTSFLLLGVLVIIWSLRIIIKLF
jgi:uncharacterized membrane protein YfcA